MKKEYIQFDRFVVNEVEQTIGFIEKKLYFAFPEEVIFIFTKILNSANNYAFAELEAMNQELDVADLIEQFSTLGVCAYTSDQSNRYYGAGATDVATTSFFTSNWMIWLYCAIASIDVIYIFMHGGIIPGEQEYEALAITQIIILYFSAFLFDLFHEMGHMFFAKIARANARLNVSTRYFLFLVFECEIDEFWILDKRFKNFFTAGGIIFDVIMILVLIVMYHVTGLVLLKFILFTRWVAFFGHLITPFKTDLYYWIEVNFKNNTIVKTTSSIIGYTALVIVNLLWFYQAYILWQVIGISGWKPEYILMIVATCLPIMISIYNWIKGEKK